MRGRDRELCAQPGAGARGAVDEDSAAEGFDAVLETDQAGASGELSAADALIADCDAQDVVFRVGFDGDRDGAITQAAPDRTGCLRDPRRGESRTPRDAGYNLRGACPYEPDEGRVRGRAAIGRRVDNRGRWPACRLVCPGAAGTLASCRATCKEPYVSTVDHQFVLRVAPAVNRRCDDDTPSHRPRSGSGQAGVGRRCFDTVSSRDSCART